MIPMPRKRRRSTSTSDTVPESQLNNHLHRYGIEASILTDGSRPESSLEWPCGDVVRESEVIWSTPEQDEFVVIHIPSSFIEKEILLNAQYGWAASRVDA